MKKEDNRKKIEEIIEQFEKNSTSSEHWKLIISKYKEEFETLKAKIALKEKELKELITKRKLGELSKPEFEIELDKVQDELVELELKMYQLRLKK